MGKRKPIPKKIRFEVLKRDSFTCQYCGMKAPDVVLHVDHIKPVAKGGANAMTNLVASCLGCNLGKGATTLSDDSAVKKSQRQAEEIQNNVEQLEMMGKWYDGLRDIENKKNEITHKYLNNILMSHGYSLSAKGKIDVVKLVKKYGVKHTLKSIDIWEKQYDLSNKDCCETALGKLSGIAYLTNKKIDDNGLMKNVYYLSKIAENSFAYFNKARSISYIKEFLPECGFEYLKDSIISFRNWTEFVDFFEELRG